MAMTASFKKKEVIDARNALEAGGAKRPLEVIVVPTRVESAELEERNNFKTEFMTQFDEFPAPFRILRKTFWDLLIPYISKYAYREKLAIGDERGSEELQKAYKTLAAHLVLLAPEGSSIRARFAEELRHLFGPMFPRVLLAAPGSDGNTDLWSLRQQLNAAGLSLWDEASDSSDGHDSSRQPTGKIDLAEFLVLPVTSEAVRSETFFRQWRYARQQGVCVQLVRGNAGVELTKNELPLWLRDAHIYDPVSEIDKLVEVLKRPCIASRVPYMEPNLPESYVERPLETRKLVTALLNSKSESAPATPQSGADVPAVDVAPSNNAAAIRIALCGPPGCGKTALATGNQGRGL